MKRTGKNVNKHFRFSESEAEILKEKAKGNDMNETEYLRFLISQRPRDHPKVQELLAELVNEINKIGVNINQIVKNHNSKFYSETDKQMLKAYMKKLNVTVKEVVDKLGDK